MSAVTTDLLAPADALDAIDRWPTLTPAEQEAKKPQLQRFAAHHGSGVDEVLRSARNQTTNAPWLSLEAEYLDDRQTYLDTLQPGEQQRLANVEALAGTTEQDRQKAANTRFISLYTGLPAAQVASTYDVLQSQVARALFDLPPGAGPGEFHGAVKGYLGKQRGTRQLVREAAAHGAKHALTDPAWARGFKAWKDAAQNDPRYDKTHDAEFARAYASSAGAIDSQVDEHRAAVRQLYDALAKITEAGTEREEAEPGRAAEGYAEAAALVAGATPAERQIFYAALSAYAEQRAPDPEGFWDNMGRALTRGGENYLRDVWAAFARGLIEQGAGEAALLRDQEAAQRIARETEETKTRMDIAAELRRVADQSVDPITPLLEENTTLGTIERGLYLFAGSAAYTAAAAVPYVGLPATMAALKEQYATDLRLKGVPSDQAETIAGFAAVPSAIAERIGARAVTGQLPALNRLINRWTAPLAGRGAAGIMGRFTARAAAAGAVEFTQESAQDAIFLGFQDLGAALSSDVPEVDWTTELSAWLDHAPELLVSVLPLALIGAGASTYRDWKGADQLFSDPDLMEAAGIDPEAAAAIRGQHAAGDVAGATQALQEAWADHDPTTDGAKAARDRMDERYARQEAAAAVGERTVLPPITAEPDGDGYTVTDPNTGATFHALTIDDAQAMRRGILEQRGIETDEATVELARRLAESQGDIDVALQPAFRTQEELVAEQALSPQEAYENVLIQEQATGQRFERDEDGNPVLSASLVLGENAAEMAADVWRGTMQINRGANITTPLEEKAELDAKRWMMTGVLTQAQLNTLIRRAPVAGLLPDEDAAISERQTIEAWSNLVVADAMARWQIAREEAPSGWRQSLANLLRGYREFFRQIVSRARQMRRARREGTVDEELEMMLEESLQLAPADQYAAEYNRAAQETAAQTQEATTPALPPPPARFTRATPAEGGTTTSLRALTPEERALLDKRTHQKFQDVLTSLPSHKEMAAVAAAGAAKKGWYRRSAHAILTVFNGDAPRFAALLAATSPQTSVEQNLVNALNIWAGWIEAGRPTDRASIRRVMGENVQGRRGEESVLAAWVPNTVRALTHDYTAGPVTISGPKVNSFMLNLLGYTQEVTNDAWMANYALVDQTLFKGQLSARGPGKGPGYLAMSAQVRRAAEYLSKTTGQDWSPMEVQETIWSWAKTLYEAAGEKSALQLIEDEDLTDEMIAGTPDFATLFTTGEYRAILQDAGYQEALATLDDTRGAGARSARETAGGQRASGQAGFGSPEVRKRHLRRAARRLDTLRRRRSAITTSVVPARSYMEQLGEVLDRQPRDPEQRRTILERVRALLETATARWEEAARERKTVTQIEAEARNVYEDTYRREVERETSYDRLIQTLEHKDFLSDLRQQPVSQYLLSGVGELRSRSRAQAERRRDVNEYDDAPYLPSYFYGGTVAPDEAAAALFEAGLITDDSVSTMWEALAREAEGVARFKETYQRVKDIHSGAKLAAQEAARTHVESQRRAQAGADRRSMLGAMATLDAALSVMPAKVRARVGGYTSLARIASDEIRLREIKQRLDRAMFHLERYLKEENLLDLLLLFKRVANPVTTEDRIRRSQVGPEAQHFIDQATAVLKISREEYDDNVAELEAKLIQATEPDKIAELTELYGILTTYGAVATRTAAELETAYKTLEDVVDRGRAQEKALREARSRERSTWRDSLIEEMTAAQQPGSAAQGGQRSRDIAQEKQRTVLGALDAIMGNWLFSFRDNLALFWGTKDGTLTRTAQDFDDRVRRASNQRRDEILRRRKEYRAGMRMALGATSTRDTNRKLHELQKRRDTEVVFMEGKQSKVVRVPVKQAESIVRGQVTDENFKRHSDELLQLERELDQLHTHNAELAAKGIAAQRQFVEVVVTVHPGEPTPQRLSTLEAIYYTMLAKYEDYRIALDYHGVDGDALADMEEIVTSDPRARNLRQWLEEQYAAGYDRINKVYRRLYGVNMPKVQYYTPGHFNHEGLSAEIDPLQTGVGAGMMGNGFIKSRRTHKSEARKTDALAAYWSHVNQVEHFLAFAELGNDLRAVFGNQEVQKVMKAAEGEEHTNRLLKQIDLIRTDGRNQAQDLIASERFMRRLMTATAHMALGYKVGTLMKQTSAAINALIGMSFYDFGRGLVSMLKTGAGSYKEIFRSATIRGRIESGYSPEVRTAMQAHLSKPSDIYTALDLGMLPIGYVDAAWTTFSAAAAYHSALTEALKNPAISEAEAKRIALDRMDAVVHQTAQPAEIQDRSFLEASRNVYAKFLFMFRSEQRQKAAAAWFATRQMFKGKLSKTTAGRRLMVAWVLMPIITETMTNLFLDVFTDIDEEDLWEWEDYAIAVALGPASGVFILGDALSGLIRASAGRRAFRTQEPVTAATLDAIEHLRRRATREDGFFPQNALEFERDLALYTRAIGQVGGGNFAALNVAANIYRQIAGFTRNIARAAKSEDKKTGRP